MPFRVAVSSCSRSLWSAGSGLRCPPILPGSVLPVSRTRRTSLIAADALTANRAAACRAELPCSTSSTDRFRRSCDKGAAITASALLNRHSQNQNRPINAIFEDSRWAYRAPGCAQLRQSRPLAEGEVRYGDDFAVMARAHRGPVSVGGGAAAYYTRDGSLIYASRARIMHERR